MVAGQLVNALCKKASIIPVDSEHSAIFNVWLEKCMLEIFRKLILTASGGPFRGYTKSNFQLFGEALKHPNWEMGSK